MATLSEQAAAAAGLTLQQYLAKRNTTLTTAGLGSQISPSSIIGAVPQTPMPGLTPMPAMPAAPTMPTFTPPSFQMPALPTLQPSAKMPSMNDRALDEAADAMKLKAGQRAGRKSTMLTSRKARVTRPTIASPAMSSFAAKTRG
jgi:hypothetical protein